MSDRMVIEQCAPTLAGLKTGSLFSCRYHTRTEVQRFIRRLNGLLRSKGIRVLPIKYMEDRVLIYLYRPDFLEKDLENENASMILGGLGYRPDSADRCVVALINRLAGSASNKEFPHEIGLFLGYPPEDVQGFICHKGADCKCVGYWKVYGDEKKAQRKFDMYKKCTAVYESRFARGTSLEKLAVRIAV